MCKILFRHSLAFKLSLAIIIFPVILTIVGFIVFQKMERNRIVEFSRIKIQQLKNTNSIMLRSALDAFQEKGMRIASDNQIIVPYKLKVTHQLNAHLGLLLQQNQLNTISILTPIGIPEFTIGVPFENYRNDFSGEFGMFNDRKSKVLYTVRHDEGLPRAISMAAYSPIYSGTKLIAILFIAKNMVLGEAFLNSLLILDERIISQTEDMSFLVPFIPEIGRRAIYGHTELSNAAVYASKVPIPGFDDSNCFLICGIDQHQEFYRNRQIIIYGVVISGFILLLLLAYSIVLSRQLTKPLFHIVEVANSISANQTDVNWLPDRKDEVGALNRSLQKMTQNLQDTIKELKMAQRQAEEGLRAKLASKAKSEFLASMSHELRTPLNHIIGFTEIVVDGVFGELNEDQKENLSAVLESSRHLLSLINDILDLSKIEAGKLKLGVSEVSIRDLLQNSLILIKEKAMKNNIELAFDLDGIPDTFEGDERKIKQIIYNLLSNAAKFTPAGGSITLSANRFSNSKLRSLDSSVTKEWDNLRSASDYIEIAIKDTGIGIKSEDLKRIFSAFEQADNINSETYQGTGLGLSLVKQFVELHGGYVWAKSEGENKGSSFNLILPVNQENF